MTLEVSAVDPASNPRFRYDLFGAMAHIIREELQAGAPGGRNNPTSVDFQVRGNGSTLSAVQSLVMIRSSNPPISVDRRRRAALLRCHRRYTLSLYTCCEFLK